MELDITGLHPHDGLKSVLLSWRRRLDVQKRRFIDHNDIDELHLLIIALGQLYGDVQEETCDRCRYYHVSTSRCLKNAPLPVSGDDSSIMSGWGKTVGSLWCGEYQPK